MLFKPTVSFQLDLDHLEDVNVQGDPLRLAQALNNLVSNASKFTQAGIVSMTAKSTRIGHTRVRVDFEVSDTG